MRRVIAAIVAAAVFAAGTVPAGDCPKALENRDSQSLFSQLAPVSRFEPSTSIKERVGNLIVGTVSHLNKDNRLGDNAKFSVYAPLWVLSRIKQWVCGTIRLRDKLSISGGFIKQLPRRFGSMPPAAPRLREGVESIWIHVAGLGELNAASELIKELKASYPGYGIVISVYEEGCIRISKERFPDADVILSFYDFPWIANKMLNTFRPRLVLMMETPFAMGRFFINGARKRGAKVVLANARTSFFRDLAIIERVEEALFGRDMRDSVDLCLPQSREELRNFLSRGVPEEKLSVYGNMKYDSLAGDISPRERQDMIRRFRIKETDFVLVAGCVWAEECKIILDAFRRLTERNTTQNLVLIMAPRCPVNFHVSETVQSAFDGSRVIVANELGILKKLYTISDVAIVGGSFVEGVGGHSIIEPASFGIPVVFGRYMRNYREAIDEFLANGAAIRIDGNGDDAAMLADELQALISDESKRAAMGHKAKEIVESHKGATGLTVKAINKLMSKEMTALVSFAGLMALAYGMHNWHLAASLAMAPIVVGVGARKINGYKQEKYVWAFNKVTQWRSRAEVIEKAADILRLSIAEVWEGIKKFKLETTDKTIRFKLKRGDPYEQPLRMLKGRAMKKAFQDAETFAEQLRLMRVSRLISSVELSTELGFGISGNKIIKWEHGSGEPDKEELQQLSKFFGVKPSQWHLKRAKVKPSNGAGKAAEPTLISGHTKKEYIQALSDADWSKGGPAVAAAREMGVKWGAVDRAIEVWNLKNYPKLKKKFAWWESEGREAVKRAGWEKGGQKGNGTLPDDELDAEDEARFMTRANFLARRSP